MPLLSFDDDLPAPPQRVLVAGTAGAGKTTLARRVGAALGVPHIEIDALYHGAGWAPRRTFEADVERFTAGPAWVTEWQYHQVRPMLAGRADLLVWLDLPRRTVMKQVVRRTARRRLRRERLWNDNVEPPLCTILWDSEHIIRWAGSTHHHTAARIDDLLRRRPDLPVVRLPGHTEAERWLQGPLRSTTG